MERLQPTGDRRCAVLPGFRRASDRAQPMPLECQPRQTPWNDVER